MAGYYTNILGYNYTSPDDWGVTLWYAAVDDPLVNTFQPYCNSTVRDTQCNEIPLPAAARSACNNLRCTGSYADNHMIIINYAQTYAWDFYQVAYCEDNSEAGGDDDNICEAGETCEWRFGGNARVRRWDLVNDDGINQPNDGLGSLRAATGSLLCGLVTYNEVVVDGVIDHAIAMYTRERYPSISGAVELYMGKNGWYPTKPNTEYYPNYPNTYGLQLGMRLQLKSVFDCEALTTDFRKIICRALKTYGMIYVDSTDPTSGGHGIYLENLAYDASRTWTGISPNSTDLGMDISDFDVVKPVCSDAYWCPDNLLDPLGVPPPLPFRIGGGASMGGGAKIQ